MPRILYQTPDGSVAVLIPAPDCGLTLEEVAAKDVPAGLAWQIVEDADVPADRAFRNAWRLQDGSIHPDHAVCCALTKDRLRVERRPLLEVLDVQVLRAMEAGLPTADLIAEKQRLRDVTKLVTDDLSLAAMKGLHP